MVFEIFRKKKRSIGMPARADIEIPPIPMISGAEEPLELPTFPTLEEAEKPGKREAISDVDEIERLAIKDVEEELEERENPELTTPIYVEARLYKGVMDDLGVLRNVLKDSADRLQMISDLMDDREKHYNIWHKQIDDIQRKLIYADNTLFSKKR
jgi:hypothetical protein